MHRIFVVQELKRMMEYKGDFIIGIIGFLAVQVSNLLFLWLIFRQVPDLMGWSVNEIVFIYGFSLLPKGLDHLLFDNLWGCSGFDGVKSQGCSFTSGDVKSKTSKRQRLRNGCLSHRKRVDADIF